MSEHFYEQLNFYKNSVEEAIQDIDIPDTEITAEVYGQVLERGGKRIRGALTINGYEMCGGVDSDLAQQAALAVEMMHAYILIIDDVQDRSATRRGGPSAHEMLEQKSRDKNWSGDHAHTGVSLALNAALYGAHQAQNMFVGLDVEPETSLRVLKLMNQTMVTTAFGQTGDIINEVTSEVTYKDIDNVLLQKTAHYTILNPLQIGMCLAGASDDELEAVKVYSLEVGRAFQIVDDLLLFSDNHDKLPEQDIKEGKMTLISCYALEHTNSDDLLFLQKQLGNQSLTPAEFERCKSIISASGAREYAIDQVQKALDRADQQFMSFPVEWNEVNVSFLKGLSEHLRLKAAG